MNLNASDLGEITDFHIHILYFEWLQTNLRESPEYGLVCAWELTLEYVIRRVCHLIKPLLTPYQLWWNLNCLFPPPLPLREAWQGTYTLLPNDGWPPWFSPELSPGDMAEMGWQQSTVCASNQLPNRAPQSESLMAAAFHLPPSPRF